MIYGFLKIPRRLNQYVRSCSYSTNCPHAVHTVHILNTKSPLNAVLRVSTQCKLSAKIRMEKLICDHSFAIWLHIKYPKVASVALDVWHSNQVGTVLKILSAPAVQVNSFSEFTLTSHYSYGLNPTGITRFASATASCTESYTYYDTTAGRCINPGEDLGWQLAFHHLFHHHHLFSKLHFNRLY